VAACERLVEALDSVVMGDSKKEQALDAVSRRVAGVFSRILGTPERPGPKLSLPTSLQGRFVEAWLEKLRHTKDKDWEVRSNSVALLVRVLHIGMRCEELWSSRQESLCEAFAILSDVYMVSL
jgi:hypothetical protein